MERESEIDMRKKRKLGVRTATAGGLILLGLPAAVAAHVQERRAVDMDVTVELEAPSHDVRVVGWDRAELEVTGEGDGLSEALRIQGDRSRMRIHVNPGWVTKRDGRVEVDVDLERVHPGELLIRLPRGAALEIRSMAGDVAVEAVDGPVDLQTHHGDVNYSGRAPAVQATTFSGDVVVSGSATKTRVKAVNGDAVVRAAGGFIHGETVSGDLEIESTEPVDAVTLSSVSGDVAFRGTLRSDATVNLKAHSGDVVLLLPGRPSARFEAVTFSGDIHNALGEEARSVSEWTSERRLDFTTGGGGARVKLQTFSGDIEIGVP